MMDSATFDKLSLQGHPYRLAIDCEDVLTHMAEEISKIDFDGIYRAREEKRREEIWQDTLYRMDCDLARPGQLSAEDVPRSVRRKGDPDEIDVVFLDDYIECRLNHKIQDGMGVYKFWDGERPVYAATVIDRIWWDGEVIDWNLRLYTSRKAANADIKRRWKEIDEERTA